MHALYAERTPRAPTARQAARAHVFTTGPGFVGRFVAHRFITTLPTFVGRLDDAIDRALGPRLAATGPRLGGNQEPSDVAAGWAFIRDSRVGDSTFQPSQSQADSGSARRFTRADGRPSALAQLLKAN